MTLHPISAPHFGLFHHWIYDIQCSDYTSVGHLALRQVATQPIAPHYNHGHNFPQARPNSRRSQSLPLVPVGNQHGKEAHGVQSFSEEVGEWKFCLLCW